MSTFISGNWQEQIDVRDFVTKNITPYDGDDAFLQSASQRTKNMWKVCMDAIKEERANNGVRAIDNELIS